MTDHDNNIKPMQKNIPLGRMRNFRLNISLGTMIAALFALLLLLVSLLLLNQFRNQQVARERNEMLLTGWQEQLLTATPAAVAREQLQERLMIEQQRFASASELLPGPDADLAILQRINEAAERSGILLTTLQEEGEFQEGALIGWQYKLGAISSLSRLIDFTARLEEEAFPMAYFTDDTILTIQNGEEYVFAGTLIIYGSTFSTAQLALPPTIAPEQMGQELQRRAKHALALQDYELALSLLLQLAAFDPENSDLLVDELLYETYFQYGLFLLNENHPSLAKEQCEAARTIDPTDERAVNCLLALEEALTPSAIAMIVTETNGSQSTVVSGTAVSGTAVSGTAVSGTAVSGTAVSGTAISGTPSTGTPPSRTATSGSGTAGASPTATQEGAGQSYPSPTRTNTASPSATQRASATRLPPTVAPPPTRTAPPPTETPNRSQPSNTPIPSDTPIPPNTPTAQPSNTPQSSNTPQPSRTPQPSNTLPPIPTSTPRATSIATRTVASNTPTLTGTATSDTPTLTVTVTLTGTAATETPSVTGTAPTDTPTVTGTPPTATPTVTGTPPTATPTVESTSIADNSVPADPYGALSPFYLPNCGLTQIKGTIRDESNAPINGVTVRVWYDGAADNEIFSLPTGQDPGKAAGEWDVVLAPFPKEGKWYVQVIDPNTNAPLSPVQTVYTDIGPCKPDEGGHQVAIVDFVKLGDGPGAPVSTSTITPTPSITLTPSQTPIRSATPTPTQTITPTPTRTAIPMVYATVHDPDLPIPDGPATAEDDIAVSTINIPDDIIISRVRVYPDIEHDDVGDLDVSLIHPDGTAIRLHSRGENAGEEAIQRWFELGGGDLAALAGKSALGEWQLEIVDRFETQVGALRNWQLEIYSP